MEINRREISSELIEKAKACKTDKELFELAREEGVELSDEQIEGISGGKWDFLDECESYSGCKRVVRH